MALEHEAQRSAHLWLPVLRHRPHPRLRLFCFPYAGGSASCFVEWADRLPSTIEVRPVQVPGRWIRMHEPPLTRVEDIVASLWPRLEPLLDRPFAFFGHSLGALLAFEMTHFLRLQGAPPPAHLYVSGRRPPQVPDLDLPTGDLSDDEFIEELRRYNGTPDEVLRNAELMSLVLPTLRADFDVCRNYAYVPRPALDIPITVLSGSDDEESEAMYLAGWPMHTTGRCNVVMFPGDHFYLRTASTALLRTLGASLSDTLAYLSVLPLPRLLTTPP